MKSCLLATLCTVLPTAIYAATSIGVQEASPAASSSSSVPVEMNSDVAVAGFQVDVQFDSALYDASFALEDQEGAVVESRLIEDGRLRVVVVPSGSGALTQGTVFRVPLTAKAGVVEDFPVLLTNFLLVGADATPLSTSIAPRVKLLGLKDGKEYNGRPGLELTALAQATAGSISRVQYFAGGVMLGEGSGSNFRFVWLPSASGPFEITAVALDSNGNMTDSRTVPVVVQHVGTFAGAVKGTYVGLLRGDPVTHATSGYVSMTSATTGTFTASVKMGGKSYSGSGRFDTNGVALIQFKRPAPLSKLSLELTQSSSSAVEQIHGRLTDGTISGPTVSGSTFVTEFTVDRVVWNTTRKPTSFGGAYTLLLPASNDATVQKAPLGTGYRTLNVNPTTGSASLGGKLADGTAVTQSTYVSKDGRVPIYNALYTNTGMISAWLRLRETPGASDADGVMDWFRAASTKAIPFKDGFTTQVAVSGSKYVKPVKFTRAITLPNLGGNVQLDFEGGGLASPLMRLATLTTTHAANLPLQGAEKPKLAVVPGTGLFNGSWVHPQTGKLTTWFGALHQKQNLGAGYFLGGTLGGSVELQPNATLASTPDDALPLGTPVLPTIKISLPTAEKVLPSGTSVVSVTGTAADAQGIQEVVYQVLHDGVLSAPAIAAGTTSWSFDIPIPAGEGGRYTVFVKSVDTLGQESEVLTRGFWVSQPTALNVAITGPGKVSTGYLGTSTREVGRLYTVTAIPNSKKKFTGWTGSLQSTSATLTFMMEDGLSLTANFSDP